MSDDDDDDEDSVSPLDQLALLGFDGGEAVDALMQCGGNVELAIEQLSSQGKNNNGGSNKKGKNKNPNNNGGKKKKGKQKRNQQNKKQQQRMKNDSFHDDDHNEDDNVHENNKDNDETSSPPPHEKKNVPKSFKEQRKQELRFKRALRDSRKVCRVCGGPHPRNKCPGVRDDGRGHSCYRDKNARKEDAKQRKEFKQQVQKDKEFLQIGSWTKDVAYYDGFADLTDTNELFSNYNHGHRHFHHHHDENVTEGSSSDSDDGIAQIKWFNDWRTLEVALGDDSVGMTTTEQRKKELKTWTGTKLRERATAVFHGDPAVIDAALKHPNPRSELVKIIMEAEAEAKHGQDDTHAEEIPKRTLGNEWPGYRGCISALSVLDTQDWPEEVLTQLGAPITHEVDSMAPINDEKDTTLAPDVVNNDSAVKLLVGVSPKEIAKWMMIDVKYNLTINGNNSGNNNGKGRTSQPVDLVFLTKLRNDVRHTEIESKNAADRLLASRTSNNKQQHHRGSNCRESAEAEVARLRKLLKAKRKRQIDSEELCDICAKRAHLDSSGITERLDKFINKNNEAVVVGVSCGLNYGTLEACDPLFGPVVREAQRQACTIAIQAALKANLPIVLECQDATCVGPSNNSSSPKSSVEKTTMEKDPIESASIDLVKILANLVPPTTPIVLRNGSLTVAKQPGLHRLLETWTNLYVGISGRISYSKCPKQLLDIVFDLPPERLILTSEAPYDLPSTLNGSKHLVPVCLPPHIACIAQSVADIKNGLVSPQQLLTTSTNNIKTVFLGVRSSYACNDEK